MKAGLTVFILGFLVVLGAYFVSGANKEWKVTCKNAEGEIVWSNPYEHYLPRTESGYLHTENKAYAIPPGVVCERIPKP